MVFGQADGLVTLPTLRYLHLHPMSIEALNASRHPLLVTSTTTDMSAPRPPLPPLSRGLQIYTRLTCDQTSDPMFGASLDEFSIQEDKMSYRPRKSSTFDVDKDEETEYKHVRARDDKSDEDEDEDEEEQLVDWSEHDETEEQNVGDWASRLWNAVTATGAPARR